MGARIPEIATSTWRLQVCRIGKEGQTENPWWSLLSRRKRTNATGSPRRPLSLGLMPERPGQSLADRETETDSWGRRRPGRSS